MIFALSTAASAVIISLGAALLSMLSPLMLAHLSGRQRMQEKQEDWARQDLVADRLAKRQDDIAAQAREAAELLLAAQTKTIARTDEVARVAAVAAASTDTQLKQIHTLVNSDMTAARQSELDQTRVTLVMLKKVVAMEEAAGRSATKEDLAAINTTEKRIGELQGILADRLAQQRVVEKEQRSAAAAAAAAAVVQEGGVD